MRSVKALLDATDAASSPKKAESALRLVADGLSFIVRLKQQQKQQRQGTVKGAADGSTKGRSAGDAIAMLQKQVGALCVRACEGVLEHARAGADSRAQLVKQRVPEALAAVLGLGKSLTR